MWLTSYIIIKIRPEFIIHLNLLPSYFNMLSKTYFIEHLEI